MPNPAEQAPQLNNQDQESDFNLSSNLEQFDEGSLEREALKYLNEKIIDILGRDEEGNLNSLETVEDGKDLRRLKALQEQWQELLEKGEISGEVMSELVPENLELEKVLEQSRKMYEYIDLDVNLGEQLRQGKIALPTKEQIKQAEQLDLTKALIIPAGVSQYEIMEAVEAKYQQLNNEVSFTETAQTMLDEPQVKQRLKQAPEKGYFFFTNPSKQVGETPLEAQTMNKPPLSTTDKEGIIDVIVPRLNQEHPKTNLRLLNSAEYFLLQAQASLDSNNQDHLDTNTYCWLNLLNTDQSRCLYGDWDEQLRVDSDAVDYRYSWHGARLAAVSPPTEDRFSGT
jgi:hypothetical protein